MKVYVVSYTGNDGPVIGIQWEDEDKTEMASIPEAVLRSPVVQRMMDSLRKKENSPTK